MKTSSLPFIAPIGTSSDIQAILGGANPASRPERSMPFPFDPAQIGQMIAKQIADRSPSGANNLIQPGAQPAAPFQLPPQLQLPAVPPPTMGFTVPVTVPQAVG